MAIDTNKLYARVAAESWQDVNAVYRECQAEIRDNDGDPNVPHL